MNRSRILGVAVAAWLLGPAAAAPPDAVPAEPLPVVRTFRVIDRIVHGHWITSIDFSPEGKRIATASRDRTVVIWSADEQRELVTFRGHEAPVACTRFSPDGTLLASGDGDGVVKVWRAADGREVRTLRVGGAGAPPPAEPRPPDFPKRPELEIRCVGFTPGGKLLAAGHGEQVTVWSLETGEAVLVLKERPAEDAPDGARQLPAPTGPALVTSLAFSPDGQELATTNERSTSIWSLESGQRLSRVQADLRIPSAHFVVGYCPDGPLLATAGFARDGCQVTLRDARTGNVIRSVTSGQTVEQIAFDGSGRRLAAGMEGIGTRITIWSADTGETIAVHKVLNENGSESNEGMECMALSPDGRTVAYAFRRFGWRTYTVRIWAVGTPDSSAVGAGFPGPRGAALSPDGRFVAAAGPAPEGGSAIGLWSVATGTRDRTLASFRDAWIASLRYSPDGKTLACGTVDRERHRDDFPFGAEQRRIISAADGKVLASMDLPHDALEGELLFLTAELLAFSPDATKLAVVIAGPWGRGGIRILDAMSLHEIMALPGHPSGTMCVAFGAGGSILGAGGSDGTVKLWSVADGGELLTFDGDQLSAPLLAFSPDGRTALSGPLYELKIWTVKTGRVMHTLAADRGGPGNALFNPRGDAIASIHGPGGDGELILWEAATGRRLARWAFSVPMILLGFTPDGRLLVTSNADGTCSALAMPQRSPPAAQAVPEQAAAPTAPEPRYEGRSVTYWVKRLGGSSVLDFGAAEENERARAALRAIGPAAIPALTAALRQERHWYVRKAAAYALGALGVQAREALPALIEALADVDGDAVAPAAVEAIRMIDPESATDAAPRLVEIAREQQSDEYWRELQRRGTVPAQIPRLAEALSGTRDLAAAPSAPLWVPLLAECLKNRREETRQWALKTLRKLGPAAAPAVPALVEALGHSKMQAQAAAALGEIGPGAREAVPALRAMLQDRSPSLRSAAAQALATIEPAPAAGDVAAFAAALRDPDPGQRIAAAIALARLGPDAAPALPALVEATRDEDSRVRHEAVKALGAMGPGATAAVSASVEALGDQDGTVSAAAASALVKLGPEAAQAAIPKLLQRLREGDSADQGAAAPGAPRRPSVFALVQTLVGRDGFSGRADARLWVPLLVELLGSPDPQLRRWAARSIGQIGAEAAPAVASLLGAMKDGVVDVRREAANALAGIGSEARAAVPALLEAIHDTEGFVDQAAARALAAIDPEVARGVVPGFIEALEAPDAQQRRRAVGLLGSLGPAAAGAVPALVGRLRDEDSEVRRAAVYALGQIGPGAEPAIPALLEELKHALDLHDHTGRELGSFAARALGQIGPTGASQALPILTTALKDPEPMRRSQAVHLLGRLGPHAKDAVPDLVAALRDETRIVRASAAWALGEVGPDAASAIPALLEAAKDADPEVRKAAGDAVKRIHGEDPDAARGRTGQLRGGFGTPRTPGKS